MIIVQLSGGIGNQLFQYALGRTLATKRATKLVLYSHAPALQAFKIQAQFTPNLNFIKPPKFDLLWMVREIEFGFQPAVLDHPGKNLMLSGYWQSERYFQQASLLIRQEFAFRNPKPAKRNAATQIRSTESVCLHVRRGDYLRPNDQRGFIGLDYYRRAAARIATQTRNPVFYVFSDDPDWCRENMKLPYPLIFMENQSAEEHLKLMTRCKHFIIANSTFSWWAAWLASNPGKLVVAPKRWFRKASGLRSTDLIPSEWISV